MFSPVCLPEQSDNFEGQIGWVYGTKFNEHFFFISQILGWGKTHEDFHTSDTVREVQVHM